MTASIEPRKPDTGRRKTEIKELFRQEDVKLNWSSVRRTVGPAAPTIHTDLLVGCELSYPRATARQTAFKFLGRDRIWWQAGLTRIDGHLCRERGWRIWATHAF